MSADFTGKTVVVTGAARGQGLAEATAFAEGGAAVVLCDLLEAEGKDAAAQLEARGLDVRFMPLDVRSPDSWQIVMREVEARQGGIDILVNNAGILKRKIIADYAANEFRQVLDVNLTGAFLGMQAVQRSMRARGGGAIVNISSHVAYSGHYDPAYGASKWGLRGLTVTAAMEFAPDGIRVNSVSPGLVLTDINRDAPHVQASIAMIPMGRPVDIRDVVEVVLFLASDRAGMITGEDIVVDGGFIRGGIYRRLAMEARVYPDADRNTVA